MIEQLISTAPAVDPELLRVRKRELTREQWLDFIVPSRRERWTRGARPPSAIGFRNATLSDVSRVLKGNWLLWDADLDRVVAFYLHIDEDTSGLIPYLQRINWQLGSRNDGTPSRSNTVGYLERNPVRQRDFCRMAGLETEDPEAHRAILHYASVATAHYAQLNPELYRAHMAEAHRVLDDYRVEDTPFTSGIVNRDNVLPLHFDSGNFPHGEWSLMLGFKRDIGPDEAGNAGELIIPEYDLAFAIEDNTLSGFDGQVSLHGVSPFRKLSRHAYRYTIVYYSKVGMWQCLGVDEELRRAEEARTRKEMARWRSPART